MIAMDLLQCDVTLTPLAGGVNITGWSESGDCLSFPEIESAKVKRGADGKMVGSRTGDFGGPVTIKVLANAPIVDILAGWIALFENAQLPPFELVLLNRPVGDIITCVNGIITKYPSGTSYGKGEVGEMSYTFEFERITFAPTANRSNLLSTITGGIF